MALKSIAKELINKRWWTGMSTGGEYQELFQKAKDRNVNWASMSCHMRERQKGVDDMNIKASYGISNGR